jgi:hypothetical protein
MEMSSQPISPGRSDQECTLALDRTHSLLSTVIKMQVQSHIHFPTARHVPVSTYATIRFLESQLLSPRTRTTSSWLELGNVNPQDVFNEVWSRRGATSCDTTAVDLGQGCSIKFTCDGGIPWTTTNGMSSTLHDIVGSQSAIANHWTTTSTVCTQWVGESTGPVCIQETQETIYHTSIAQTIQIVNLPLQTLSFPLLITFWNTDRYGSFEQ